MGASYSPTFTDYSDLKPFRFWCQKVMPAIYDDSLSYYELLTKVVKHLNDIIDNMEAVEANTDALLEAYNQLQEYVNNYFESLDVQTAIDNTLDTMVESGAFDEAIGRAVAANIDESVSEQISDAVSQQITGAVADQIDDAVEEQIGADAAAAAAQAAADWLDENLSPTGTTVAIDDSLTVSGAAADAKAAGIRIAQLDSEMKGNRYDVLAKSASYSNGTVAGITFTFNELERTVTVNGNATGEGFRTIYSNNAGFPDGMKRGKRYYFEFDSPDSSKFVCQAYKFVGGSLSFLATSGNSGRTSFEVPNDATGILIRLYFTSAFTANNVKFNMPKLWTTQDFEQFDIAELNAIPTMDLNDFVGNKTGLCIDTNTYTNIPLNEVVGFVNCIKTGNWCIQTFWSFTGGRVYKRRGNSDGSVWESWIKLMGATNNYTMNSYQNTYNVNATPSISTGNDYFLESTGDTTDRTNDIITMLQTNGICRLGSGLFVVNNLVMPDNTRITGQGKASIVRLGASGSFSIKMGSYCKVDNILIEGSDSDITILENVGVRDGILWQGNYNVDQSVVEYMSIVENCWIRRFTGSGIKCYNMGYGTATMIMCENIFIENCSAGINIAYWSEFNKFTNVRVTWCWYGCINNGGNNMFVNCDFSSCKLGFLIDNSENQSPNNSHGSCVGCVFNHMDDNTGDAVRLLNADSGFMFNGCQIFFGKIYSYGSNGVVFDGCNFGYNNCNITIESGGTHLFSNCMFQNKPPISVVGNTKVHFVNCYNRSSGSVINYQ